MFSPIFLGFGFLIILIILALIRKHESGQLRKIFKNNEIILKSYGVEYFGLQSEKGGIPRIRGALVLFEKGIYFKARFSKKYLLIDNNRIKGMRVVEFHKGRPLYQKSLAMDFISNEGKIDTAVFRVPFPEQWHAAIERYLLR